MNLLLTFVLSAALVPPARSIAVAQPDSGSVAFSTATVRLGSPSLEPEDALALLQSEHHFSIAILLLEDPTAPAR